MSPLSAGTSSHLTIPRYPGHLWLDAAGGAWEQAGIRGYSFGPMDGPARAARHVIVVYRAGSTNMCRDIHGERVSDRVTRNDVSIKSVGTRGKWSWDQSIDVLNIYVDPALLERTAEEIFGPGSAPVRLRDCVKTRDDELVELIGTMEREAARQAPGALMMALCLQRQLAITLLRNHAEVDPRQRALGAFSMQHRESVLEYIEGNLHSTLQTARLANELGFSADHFSRLFRETFDTPPQRYIMGVRIKRASELLCCTSLTVADIAHKTGFADQSHLTRRFTREFGLSPSQWRACGGSSPLKRKEVS